MRVSDILKQRSVPAYLVGGAIRDDLLGRSTDDVDLVIDGSPHEVGPELALALRGRLVSFDVPRDMVRIVIASGSTSVDIDLARMVGDTIEEDLRRRDFTVDAIAADLDDAISGDYALIDPLNGLSGYRVADNPCRIRHRIH